MLTAHLRQARTLLQRIRESERLWDQIEAMVSDRGLPDRTISVLWDAAMGFRVRNATYRASFDDDEITDQTASRDLRQLVDARLLVPHGEKRGRFYIAGEELGNERQLLISARDPRDDSDPFAEAS